ncbi:MAG: TIGR03915 family putative DNA repair protein [Clostridiales bacterium]|nr:TIGR03915 family putative DNA repair protein [Clostridiales bacterium]
MNYLYDKSFEGFLTCVWHDYYSERAEGICAADGDYQLDLLRYGQTVETDAEKAARVLEAIERKISVWDAERLYRVQRTNEPEKEMKMLRYIRLGFRIGGRLRLLHGDPVVLAVQKAEQRLGAEAHRFCGILRFSSLGNNLLYASIEPDNDILEFIAPHFADRFRWDPFLIHDLRRGKALFAYNKEWKIAPLPADTKFAFSAEEDSFRTLWKRYFDAMAIKERTNPACQRRFLPARYWKHLPEMQNA